MSFQNGRQVGRPRGMRVGQEEEGKCSAATLSDTGPAVMMRGWPFCFDQSALIDRMQVFLGPVSTASTCRFPAAQPGLMTPRARAANGGA